MKTWMVFGWVLALAPIALAAHPVDGIWTLDVTLGGQQAGTATFQLVADDDGVLTGTYNGAVGTEEITGSVKGSDVEFGFDSQAGKVSYKGAVSGDTMKGTCSYGMLGDGTFEGTRKDDAEPEMSAGAQSEDE
ncbi:MAG: hypothetical protein P8Y95_03630 [Gammaproteobacteria bacterium]|jgi:hypothetical protein